MEEEVVLIHLDEKDKEEYEIMDKILYLAVEFDCAPEHVANMDVFASTNDSFVRKFAEIINELISKGNKMVAFATYYKVISLIYTKLKNEYNMQFPIYEISRQSSQPEERQRIISMFENCLGGALLLTTNVLTAGYKINKANYLFHLDVPNMISTVKQRNKRICFVGSDFDKKVYYLVSKDTLQEQKYKKIMEQRKLEIAIMQ